MIRYVAVIDLGKSNTKLALVDTHNACELNVVSESASVTTTGLYPAINHLVIERFLISAFKELGSLHPIDAITVTTHGATAALIDKQGELVLPVLDYECPLPDDLANDYAQHRPSFDQTGSPRLPGGLNIGAQLFWQQAVYPQQFALAQTLLTWPQYWVFRLTGERYNDITSLGAHSDLYNPLKQCYSSLLETLQWTRLMPPTRQPGSLINVTNTNMTEQLGLKAPLPVYSGIHDSNASLVPHLLANKRPFSVVSTGTWFISMAIGGEPITLAEKSDTLLNVNAFGEAVPSARFMGGRERELIIAGTDHTTADQPITVTDFLSDETANATMLMPSSVAGTGPFPDSKMQWLGPACTNPALRDLVVSFYLALMTDQCLRLIGSRGPTYIEGPLAHDSAYTSMLQVVSQRDVYVSDSVTGTSIGAAMLIKAPLVSVTTNACQVEAHTQQQLAAYAARWEAALKSHVIKDT